MILFQSPEGHRLSFDHDSLKRLLEDKDRTMLDRALTRRKIVLHTQSDHMSDEGDALYGAGQDGELAVRAAQLPPVRLEFFGSCLTQFGDAAIQREAYHRGHDAVAAHQWLGLDALQTLRYRDADVVVLQVGAQALLTPIFKSRSERDLDRAITGVVGVITRLIEAARSNAPAAVLIVHTIAAPTIWPPHLTGEQWRRGWSVLDAQIREAAQRCEAMLLDETALAYRHGAQALFDDLQFPWSHHGGRTDLSRNDAHQNDYWHQVLAKALWDAWETATAPSIKAVVTDLDGVLWPGVAAEGALETIELDTNLVWMHQGIQEALSSYEAAGVVLATLSKGDEAVTLTEWRAYGKKLNLSAEQFAVHSIDWSPKAERMSGLLASLQVTADRVVFIDDHPAEREAMRRTFPAMTVLGDDLPNLRERILTLPGLQHAFGAVSGSRTTSTRAAIERESLRRDFSEEAFLEHLQISKEVRSATQADLPRIRELLSRTTQFTLANGRPFSSVTVDRSMVLEVKDRYSDYGLVGVSVIDEAGTLICYAVSCRVIGLAVGMHLLTEHAQRLGLRTLRVELEKTERNGVLRDALEAMRSSRNDHQLFLDMGGDRDEVVHVAHGTN